MSKYLGRIEVPLEVIEQTGNRTLRNMLLLPRSVRVTRVLTRYDNMVKVAILESDEQVEGYTFPVPPGTGIPFCAIELYLDRYIKIKV